MMEISPEIVAFIGILLSCMSRTVLPYAKKYVEENGNIQFSLKYVVSFIVVVIAGFVATMLVFPLFTIPEGSELYIFAVAFGFAWASNDIINRVLEVLT